MKKLMLIVVSAGIVSISSYGQHGHGGGIYYRPQTTVVVGGGLGFSPFYYPYYSPFGYYGYPYYGSPAISARASKLDQEIADINHDYSEKIESVRMDSQLSGKERRHEIRELKSARDNEIANAKSSYYKS